MKILIAKAMLVGMFALLISWTGLYTHYANTRPKMPDPVSGHVMRINSHGAVAYLTRGEDLLLNSMFLGGILCAVVGGGLWRASETDASRKLAGLK